MKPEIYCTFHCWELSLKNSWTEEERKITNKYICYRSMQNSCWNNLKFKDILDLRNIWMYPLNYVYANVFFFSLFSLSNCALCISSSFLQCIFGNFQHCIVFLYFVHFNVDIESTLEIRSNTFPMSKYVLYTVDFFDFFSKFFNEMNLSRSFFFW